MRAEDIQALHMAVATLEHPRLAARLAEIAGKPIELFNRALPETASKAIAVSATQALNTAVRVALRTMENERWRQHRVPSAAASGWQPSRAIASGPAPPQQRGSPTYIRPKTAACHRLSYPQRYPQGIAASL